MSQQKRFQPKRVPKRKRNGKRKPNSRRGRQNANPISRNVRTVNRGPRMQATANTLTVTHKEFLLNIEGNSQSAYKVLHKLRGQPGSSRTFPWLSQIAGSYESYSINNLQLHYSPSCNTTTPGALMFLLDYDATDEVPDTLTELLNSYGAVTTTPYSSTIIRASRQNLNKAYKERYIDTGVNGLNTTDIKLLDFATIIVASNGIPASGLLGSLFISYSITFKTPQYTEVSGPIMFIQQQAPSLGNPITGINSNPYSTAGPKMVTITRNSGYDRLTFNNEGYYLATYFAAFSTTLSSSEHWAGGQSNLITYATQYNVAEYGANAESIWQRLIHTNQGGILDCQLANLGLAPLFVYVTVQKLSHSQWTLYNKVATNAVINVSQNFMSNKEYDEITVPLMEIDEIILPDVIDASEELGELYS